MAIATIKKLAAKKSVQAGIIAVLVLALVVVIVTRVNIARKNNSVGIPVSTMEAQKDANHIYRFDSVAWVYDFLQSFAVDQSTKVSFQFVNFTRNESLTPAVFYKPFLVGVFEGSCTELTALPADATAPFAETDDTCPNGPLLAVTQCGETYIAIHQCGLDLSVAKSTGMGADMKWETIRTLDISKLVN